MKRKLLILSVLVICIANLAAGTLAYFNAEDTAHNVITSGGVGIKLIEKTKSDDGDTLVDFPEGGLTGIVPGTSASKIVSVENTGSAAAWIRVKVETTITGSDKEALALEIGDDDNKIPVITFTPGENWTLGEDGYYYYNKSVAAGDSTGTLFEEVNFAPQMGNEYQNCTANLVVSAQAVQTANNGESVSDANGWPVEDTAEEPVEE